MLDPTGPTRSVPSACNSEGVASPPNHTTQAKVPSPPTADRSTSATETSEAPLSGASCESANATTEAAASEGSAGVRWPAYESEKVPDRAWPSVSVLHAELAPTPSSVPAVRSVTCAAWRRVAPRLKS